MDTPIQALGGELFALPKKGAPADVPGTRDVTVAEPGLKPTLRLARSECEAETMLKLCF